MYANVQEGKVHPLQGYRYKQRGKKAGIPDICLPYPSKEFHSLYIELKRRDRKNHPTAAQLNWIHKLRKAGHCVEVAYGWEDAWNKIKSYLNPSVDTKDQE